MLQGEDVCFGQRKGVGSCLLLQQRGAACAPPNTSTLQLLHGAEGYLGIESEREEGKKAGGGMVS